LHLRDAEVADAEGANFAFLLELGEQGRCFFDRD